MTLQIAKGFTLPDDIQTQTTAILGIRGSGKTTTARVLVEGLADQHRAFVWIDPLDVAWGVKSSADGKHPGHAVIIAGGSHADVPLAEGDGAIIADFAVENSVPLILSLRHLRKGAQRRFVTDFAEQLYHRKGESKHRTPLLVVIDECDSFIPQRVGGAEARMVGAIEDLCRRGRSAGIGVLLISQRAASINKDVLTQIELLIAHRHTSPQDRKALEAWIEAHDTDDRRAEFMSSLASLPQGRAWFWSPGLDLFRNVDVRAPRTFDSSATPKPGAKAITPKSLAEVDLDAIRAKLSRTIEAAKADDPRELRKLLAVAKAEIKRLIESRRETETRTVEVPILRDSDVNRLSELFRDTEKRFDRLLEVFEKILTAVNRGRPSPTADHGMKAKAAAAVRTAKETRIASQEKPADSDSSLQKCDRAILQTLSQNGACDIGKLALLSGYRKSGGFRNALARLRTSGMIVGVNSGRIEITSIGEAEGPFDRLPQGQDLRNHWMNHSSIQKCDRQILAELIHVYPDSMNAASLARATGYQVSGGFRNALSRLRTAGVLVGSNSGEMSASAHLFE